MALRLATFNVENLFERAKALNTTTWAEGQPVLQAFEGFNTLANHGVYSQADKQAMLDALETLQILQRTAAGALWFNRDPFEDVPLAVGFRWGPHDGSYLQAPTAAGRSSVPGSSAVARSSARAS